MCGALIECTFVLLQEMPRPPETHQPSLLSSVTDQFKQWWKGST